MSLLAKGIDLAQKVKHQFQDKIREHTPVYLSPVRRIAQVATKERVCAMTFDDGPCRLPANPDNFGGKPLTLVLAETLEKYGAKGTFNVVGDTSGNYPDVLGQHGSTSWCGASYDHYPDFGKDSQGGIVHCPELVGRLLDGGHEIASHTYAHVPFGWNPLVCDRRHYLPDLDAVMDDLKKLHSTMRDQWEYSVHFSKPPRGADTINGGYSSYDALGLMGYQYVSAGFDGAGRAPLTNYDAEVEATWRPIEKHLKEDPNYFCGQIICQKDGYNMARRSPVADGLVQQLDLLKRYGYRVVTVSELMSISPVCDVMPDSDVGKAAARLLERNWCVAYRDNSIRPDQFLTRGELAMMGYGWTAVSRRVSILREKISPFKDLSYKHPYAAAAKLAVDDGALAAPDGRFCPDDMATPYDVSQFCISLLGKYPKLGTPENMTHGEFILLAASLLNE